jgi:6-phosphogluconolactonase
MEPFKFDSREAASQAAADRIVAALERRLEAQGDASLVVSGGSTPHACLEALAGRDLDWSSMHVALSDERWVPPTHDDSNERMVRETLLEGRAAGAALLPMYAEGTTAEARAAEIDEEIRSLPFPFAAVLLGMGADGHFASLFPDADGLEEGLDPDSVVLCTAVSTAASPHPRLSLTMSALSRTDEIVLLIFGEEKRETLNAALAADSDLPVARLLRQKRAPVSVIWAP